MPRFGPLSSTGENVPCEDSHPLCLCYPHSVWWAWRPDVRTYGPYCLDPFVAQQPSSSIPTTDGATDVSCEHVSCSDPVGTRAVQKCSRRVSCTLRTKCGMKRFQGRTLNSQSLARTKVIPQRKMFSPSGGIFAEETSQILRMFPAGPICCICDQVFLCQSGGFGTRVHCHLCGFNVVVFRFLGIDPPLVID